MKLSNLITITLTAAVLSACGKADSNKDNEALARAVSIANHRASECPSINGKFSSDGGATSSIYKTEHSANGVTLQENSLVFVVDGYSRRVDDNPQFSYVGICSDSKIVINLYRNSNFAGTLSYVLKNSQLLFEGKSSEDASKNMNIVLERVDKNEEVKPIDPGVNAPVPQHDVADCPDIQGTWVQIGGDQSFTFTTPAITNGIRIIANGSGTNATEHVELDIDGKFHDYQGGAQLGICIDQMIALYKYANSKSVSTEAMLINEKGQLEIHTKFHDPESEVTSIIFERKSK